MLEAERVADLVRDDVPNQLDPSDRRAAEGFARADRADPTCRKYQSCNKFMHVVIELDVGLENLAGPRIVDVRARRVLDR